MTLALQVGPLGPKVNVASGSCNPVHREMLRDARLYQSI